jgi:hypothetical protein
MRGPVRTVSSPQAWVGTAARDFSLPSWLPLFGVLGGIGSEKAKGPKPRSEEEGGAVAPEEVLDNGKDRNMAVTEKPKCKLVGMFGRLMACGSYDAALMLFAEYVEIQ